jgi:hypothetical protein
MLENNKQLENRKRSFDRNMLMIKLLQSPKHIDISNFSIDQEIAKVISDAIRKNFTAQIDIRNCRIEEAEAKLIMSAILSSRSLTSVNFQNVQGASQELKSQLLELNTRKRNITN